VTPTAPPEPPRARELAGGAIILTLLVALFHGPSLAGGFVYDDHWTIEDNAFLRAPGGVGRLLGRDLARAGVPDAGRPTMLATELLDRALWGSDPRGYHLQSLVWHLGVVLLLFAASAALTGRFAVALATAGLFAVHPLGVEAVAAINYREDLLAAFFTLAALCLAGRGWLALVLAGASVCVGTLAKENAVMAPVLLVILALSGRRVRARDVAALASGGALATLWRTWALGGPGIVSLTAEVPAQHRSWSYALPTGALAFVQGVWHLVVPFGLSPEYDEGARGGWGWLALALVVGGVAGAVRVRRRWPWVTLGVLGAVVAYLPTMGLVAISNLRADRYLYWPSAGLLLALASVAVPLLERLPGTFFEVPRAWVVMAAVLAALGMRTLRQGRIWRNDLALWTRGTEVAPRSPRAWNALAEARLRAGATGPALEAVQRSLALAEDAQTRELLGLVQMERGDLRAARETLAAALATIPRRQRPELLNDLGVCELELGGVEEALAHFREAQRLAPDYDRPFSNAGRALEKLGRPEEARSAYQRARALGSQDPLVAQALERLR
jgi:Flp pilus assembly protein TadD